MDKSRNNKASYGIYLSALLMMGLIGIASGLSTISENFPSLNQATIASLISLPSLVIIPVTIVASKLTNYISSKKLLIIGIIIFIVVGTIPYFLNDFTAILISRAFFGIAIGLIQVFTISIVSEHFDGEQRNQIVGRANSFQMLGGIIMSTISGQLASVNWNLVFLVHLIGVISLIGVIILIPNSTTVLEDEDDAVKEVASINSAGWKWILTMFLFFVAGQIISNSMSFLVQEKAFGSAAEAGFGISIFSVGGFISGFLFSAIFSSLKKYMPSFSFLLLATGYLVVIYSTSLTMLYAGAMIAGLAFSLCMPVIFIESQNAVSMVSAGLIVAYITASQNLGAFVSPYISSVFSNQVAGLLGFTPNELQMLLGVIILVFIAIWHLIRAVKSSS